MEKDFENIEIPIVQKLHDFYIELHKEIARFPKFERHTLGERLSNAVFEALELVMIGNTEKKYFKEEFLVRANGKIELLKIELRVAHKIRLFDDRKYLRYSANLQEVGRMLSGWIKYTRSLK